MCRRLALIVFALVTLLPRLALSQPPPPPPPPEREGSAEFAFVGTSGNSSTQTIGLGGELIYRPAPWESRIKLTFVRNEADDQLKAMAFGMALRAQRPIRERLAGYGQYGYQRDRFAGMLHRHTAEVGLAFKWIDEASQKLVVDGGIGYANEDRMLGRDLSTATLGTGGLYTLKISETSLLTEEGRFLASLSRGRDWRYANALALTAKVSAIFSLKVSNTIRYLNLPTDGFKHTDAITSAALVAKF